MSEIANCKKCGRLYTHHFGIYLCPDCRRRDEENFERVKEYLYNNKGASLIEVSSELDIPIETIKRYLREGKLETYGNAANSIIECEKCGKPIRTGRYCNDCTLELSREINSAVKGLYSDRLSADSQAKNRLREGGLLYKNKDDTTKNT